MKIFLGTKYKVKIASYKEDHFQNPSMTKGEFFRIVLVEEYKRPAGMSGYGITKHAVAA
tara:strand:+ start:364 stop:540 length:177 start_codon:yes stop_codon:yes gene_type:complete